jgi:Family of unknown function (DUF6527)
MAQTEIWNDDNGKMVVWDCPNRPKHPCGVAVEWNGSSPRKVWNWDGNEAAPTLSPSVHCVGVGCGWHGFIRNGMLESV